ncbi:hydroxy amino acid dehydratase [Yersinia frederiksenii]|uniref:L-threonine dehydratase catabolic TdcB n=2 Tax=Yersinia frederiksenii TaxID=29484 RepID=A0A380PYW8_YERFR|nr:threo-3-hydroxy-L-aspartate ammonia-lyase [Yersinia frederiksenii]ATM96942.1 serine dehydratase [Yersinia frederiksenii]EEQ15525.1 Serine/threonine dehydratase family protein [Yersinia frederiksenii ATCC 33641]KGA45898.1 pyridoxal-phosphate dependent enzyme family protein [Yersinia frederiksenii ATCC 33641]MDN0118593.1 threo-3-hydroxy-L-aspartate ammonia-lyase [Yersinia frederiksenii]CNC86092.1 hydroxy amino acid dehydratase [Yersinia frederiksenii]
MAPLAICYDDIIQAHQRLAGFALKTPVLTSSTADEMTGAQLFFKCENFQHMGAFKFRGAYNALVKLSPEQKAKGVVAFSSGNHAQAIALSARKLGIRAIIVMPEDAPAAKIAATRGYGGEVVLYDRYQEDREAISNKLAQEQGLTLIPPYDYPDVMAGQGTAAQELFDEVGELDVLLVPLGGGGLLSGCATVAKALYPNCQVIGVEPAAGNDGQLSFRSGKVVKIATPATIADGAQTQALGHYTFPVIQERVDNILTATDEQLISAMKFFTSRMKIVVEPTGCLGAAVAFGDELDLRGKRVGVIISGGNVDLARLATFIGEAC